MCTVRKDAPQRRPLRISLTWRFPAYFTGYLGDRRIWIIEWVGEEILRDYRFSRGTLEG